MALFNPVCEDCGFTPDAHPDIHRDCKKKYVLVPDPMAMLSNIRLDSGTSVRHEAVVRGIKITVILEKPAFDPEKNEVAPLPPGGVS